MALIRFILGKVILFLDSIFSPRPKTRTEVEQQRLAGKLVGLELYQFHACPFCVKVRRFLKREGISIPLRDARSDPFRQELREGGGKVQVPCLKITQKDGTINWLYESDEIISYLRTELSLPA